MGRDWDRERSVPEWGVAVSSSHVASAAPSSSHSSPAPVWGPTHVKQSSMNCFSLGGHKSCQQTCFPLHGSTGPARSLLQHGLSTASQPPLGIHLLRRGVLCGLQMEICSTMDVHGLQGDSLPHHGLLHRLQGNLCSGAWNTSSPSFTDFGVCRVVSVT